VKFQNGYGHWERISLLAIESQLLGPSLDQMINTKPAWNICKRLWWFYLLLLRTHSSQI